MNASNESLIFYNHSVSGLTQVIHESLAEQIVSLVFLLVPALVTLITQFVVILTIVLSPALHDAHFYIMFACCVADLVVMLMSTSSISMILILGQQEWMCRGKVMVYIIYTSFHGNTLKVAVIAYERFVYFVQPYEYLHRFTSRRVAGYVAAPYVLSAVWVLVRNFTHGRTFHASALACYLPNNLWLRALHSTLFFVPPSIMCIFTIVRVLKLTRNVSPEVTSSAAAPVQQIRRAVRMLLLMSGTFWMAVLPGHLIHLGVFMSGITWADVDSRQNRTAAVFVRISTWLYMCFPAAVNPAIYSRRDLRTAMFRKLLHDQSGVTLLCGQTQDISLKELHLIAVGGKVKEADW